MHDQKSLAQPGDVRLERSRLRVIHKLLGDLELPAGQRDLRRSISLDIGKAAPELLQNVRYICGRSNRHNPLGLRDAMRACQDGGTAQ